MSISAVSGSIDQVEVRSVADGIALTVVVVTDAKSCLVSPEKRRVEKVEGVCLGRTIASLFRRCSWSPPLRTEARDMDVPALVGLARSPKTEVAVDAEVGVSGEYKYGRCAVGEMALETLSSGDMPRLNCVLDGGLGCGGGMTILGLRVRMGAYP